MRKNVVAWMLVFVLGITNTLTVMGAEPETGVSVQEEITEEDAEQEPEEETGEQEEAEKESEETVTGDDLENKEDENGEKTAEEDNAAEGADEKKQEEIESAEKQQNENLEIGTVVDTGSCGEHLTYTITVNGKDEEGNDTYTLEIEGYGEMKNYGRTQKRPWGAYKITELYFSEDVTSIGDYAFQYHQYIKNVIKLPANLKKIGEYAFDLCHSIRVDLNMPSKLTSIGGHAFQAC